MRWVGKNLSSIIFPKETNLKKTKIIFVHVEDLMEATLLFTLISRGNMMEK